MEEDYGFSDKGLDRILALSDGIFAFSLTLLALSLVVPQITSGQPNIELPQKLFEEIPNFIIFFWSFFIVSFYWIAHHRVFRYIKRYDGILIWCNLILLMFITLVPFITNLNIHYGNLQIAVIVSAIFYSIPGFALSILWLHSSKNHLLIDKKLSGYMITVTRNRNFIAPLVFVTSIPLSYIHPYLAIFFWLMMIPLRLIVNRKPKAHVTN
jgi:TMEM175 potassium channel family protein